MSNNQISLCEAEKIAEQGRKYFNEGHTLPIKFRLAALKRLKANILASVDQICAALKADLGKSPTEAYMSEIGMVICELNHTIKNLKKWAQPQPQHTALFQFSAKSYTYFQPYGVVLVSSPWNYPFLLTLDPLVGAVAAGNCVVLKPSGQATESQKVIIKLIANTFDAGHVSVLAGKNANQTVMQAKYDYIFFTGSAKVGSEIMSKAAQTLTPVSLELGGKSPCIVDKSANLKLAAKRIAFGKYLNCGQTCVAPDYCLVQESIKDAFIKELKTQIEKMYGKQPLDNPNYGKIINQKQYSRLINLLKCGQVVHGGQTSQKNLQIEPTILDNVSAQDDIMQQEIFGPILPILTYKNIDEAISFVNTKDKPLALYLFAGGNKIKKQVLSSTSFGGGCINDTIMHIASTSLGFGGVGKSGMGKYHGINSFLTFSNACGILKKANWIDLPLRYQPYNKLKYYFIKKFMK